MSAANARVGALAGLLGGVGMAFGLAVWLVDQYMLWPAIDQTAAQAFTPWVLAVGHLLLAWSRPCCSAGCRPTAAWVGSSPPDDGRTGFPPSRRAVVRVRSRGRLQPRGQAGDRTGA